MTDQPQAADKASTLTLWFGAATDEETRRRVTLTRDRVVAEALAVINADGVEALSMRALAARLGVVPGALYRHVRSKEQLHDLVLDAVLADVERQVDASDPWTDQVTVLAQRLRTVLENRPGVAGLLKARAPLTPHSLAVAEAILAPLQQAGLPREQTAAAYHLIYDYTVGFALSDPTSISEQRLQDAITRDELRSFLRSLPADRFPVLATIGEQVWIDNRDERFATGLRTLIQGVRASQPPGERLAQPDS